MNKTILIGLCILFSLPIILAAAPTTPSTLTTNNSVLFTPEITCSGSTDADSDPIYYEIYAVNISDGVNISDNGCAFPVEDAAQVNDRGVRFTVANGADGIWLIGIKKPANSRFERVLLKTSAGVEIDTIDNLGTSGTAAAVTWINFDKPIYLAPGTNYRIEADNYSNTYEYSAKNAAPGFPITGDGVIFASGSESGGDVATAYNVATIVTQNLTRTFYNETAGVATAVNLTKGEYTNWWCRACDTNGECSAFTENRTLYYMLFDYCNDVYGGGSVALNFSGYDEETLANLINLSFFADWTLSGTDDKTYNYELSEENQYTYAFCLDPDYVYVNITGFIDYDSNQTDYSYPRQYYFDEAAIIGNSVQDIGLYQLSDTYATAVTFNVVRNGVGVEDVIIHLQRYNPGTGEATLVAMGETSGSGSETIYLRLTDAWYKIFAYENGDLIYSSGPEHILTSTYNIYLGGAAGEVSSYWEMWQHFDNIIWNISWNNDSHLFGATFDDSTGAANTVCLKVDKLLINQTENICYNCTTSVSGTIYCGVTDLDASYVAKFIADVNPWRVLGQLYVNLKEDLKALIGNDGIFYSILIIGLLTFLGIWNPSAAIILAVVGLIVTSMLGFLNIGIGFIMSFVIAAIILLYKLKT